MAEILLPEERLSRPTTARVLRVALVGCGAVSRANLLPALSGHEEIAVAALVDRDERRARELADAYGVTTVLTDMEAVRRETIDAVVLATPAGHHASATMACARRGLHVLVEKPMATSAADAQAMVNAAREADVVLSVGLYRRFLPAVQLLKTLLESGEYGRPIAVDAEEGGPYGWQLAALDGLRRASGGGGVLIDIGSHVIDVVLYALGATVTLDEYQDNHCGGIETDCLLRAALHTRNDTLPLRLELSRTRELRGSIKVECERATLELLRGNFMEVLVHPHQTSAPAVRLAASWPSVPAINGYEAFRREIDDWVDAIAGRIDAPILAGRTVVPVVRLIEDAYRDREPLVEPVFRAPAIIGRAAPANATRVLVTGAGGFVGGRTAELLREHPGWHVAPLVRDPRSAARLARWPDEIVLGDICSRTDMDRAMRGCDAVVHCAVGTSWQADETRRVTVDGTRTVAEAALAAGVKRFVHISSFFVHRREGTGTIDERTPLDPPANDGYARNKLDAERAIRDVARRGLSTIILRPTRIYGPFSRTFTVRPLQALTEGRLAIGGEANVPGNMVYVDNVVSAISLALTAPDTLSGSAYIVTDPDQLSLQGFYEYFGAPAGLRPTLRPEWRPAPAAPARALVSRWTSAVRSIATSPELRGVVRRVLSTDPIGTLPRRWWDRSPRFQAAMLRRFGADAAVIYRRPTLAENDLIYYGETPRASSAKAEQELGYEAVPRDEAMAATRTWATYARLLPAEDRSE